MDTETLIEYIESKRDVFGQKMEEGVVTQQMSKSAKKKKRKQEEKERLYDKYKPYISDTANGPNPDKATCKRKKGSTKVSNQQLESTISTNYTASGQSNKKESKLGCDSMAEFFGDQSRELNDSEIEKQVEEFRRKLESVMAGVGKKLKPNVSNDWIEGLKKRLESEF